MRNTLALMTMASLANPAAAGNLLLVISDWS